MESVSCASISKYQIYYRSQKAGSRPTPAIHISGDVPTDGNNMKSASISNLEPSTEYCVSMRLQNNINLFSPESMKSCTVTPNTSRFSYKYKAN